MVLHLLTMGIRGRKSGADLAIVPRRGEILVLERPQPPENLSDEEKTQWITTVNTFEADHFNAAALPLLEAYCFSAVERRKIAQRVREMEEGDGEIRELDRLLAMHEREARLLAQHASRLRIASATHVKQVKAQTIRSGKPWDKHA